MFDIIVYGADNNNGLSLIRSLGKAGLRILVIARNSDAIGRHSLYATETLIMPTSPPSAKYLNNLAKYRKIKYIIAHEHEDILYLADLSANGQLNDLTLIAHPIEVINRFNDNDFKNNLFNSMNLKHEIFSIIDSFEACEDYLLQATYPIIFYPTSLVHSSQLYCARNFIEFKRKIRHFLNNKQSIKILTPKIHHLPIYEDYYFISNKEIEYIWRTKSFLHPFNPLYKNHSISCYHQRKNKVIDDVALKIFDIMHIDNDILGIKYFIHSDDIYYFDIDITVTPHNLSLLNEAGKNMSLSRLSCFGLTIEQHHKKQSKNLLYISGDHLFSAIGTVTDPIFGIPLTLKGKNLYNPLFDYHDIKPFFMMLFLFVLHKLKTILFSVKKFISSKFEYFKFGKRIKMH